MPFSTKVRGVLDGILQFYKADGPFWKGLRGATEAIEARSVSPGNPYIVGRGANPVAANDWVTMGYAEGRYAPIGAANNGRPIGVAAALTSPVKSTGKIPAGAIISRVDIVNVTPYSPGATMVVTIGALTIMAAADIDLTASAGEVWNDFTPKVVPAEDVVTVTINGAPTAGAANVYVYFDVPLA